jgi:hypothetical protein
MCLNVASPQTMRHKWSAVHLLENVALETSAESAILNSLHRFFVTAENMTGSFIWRMLERNSR